MDVDCTGKHSDSPVATVFNTKDNTPQQKFGSKLSLEKGILFLTYKN